MAKTPREIWFGNPPEDDHEPVKQEIVDYLLALETASTGSGGKVTKTWAQLSALTGSYVGEPGVSYQDPNNNHTDPVYGGTVPNEGLYSWSGAAWGRIANRSPTALELASALQTLDSYRFDAAVANNGLLNTYLNQEGMPGETPRFFTSGRGGRTETLADATYPIISTEYGRAVRLTNVAPSANLPLINKRTMPLLPGRIVNLTWMFLRSANVSDPGGDAVELRVCWLDKNQDLIDSFLVERVVPFVADGLQIKTRSISRDLPADIQPPVAAKFLRSEIRVYGNGGATDVIVQDVRIASGAVGPSGGAGPTGAAPGHVWVGTTLAFRNPDGTLGPAVDLRAASVPSATVSAGGITANEITNNAGEQAAILTKLGATAFIKGIIGDTPAKVRVYSNSGPAVWTKPLLGDGITPDPRFIQLYALCTGGGGGGGAATGDNTAGHIASGAGGGAGGSTLSLYEASALPASVSMTIGIAGAPGTGSGGAGGTGGTTSFGTLQDATGGTGGAGKVAAATLATSIPGLGGGNTIPGNLLNFRGGPGQCWSGAVADPISGDGGSPLLGGGARGRAASTDAVGGGDQGVSPGAGGAGAAAKGLTTATGNGGAGKAGLIILIEIYSIKDAP
jgi:hypothetical protein